MTVEDGDTALLDVTAPGRTSCMDVSTTGVELASAGAALAVPGLSVRALCSLILNCDSPVHGVSPQTVTLCSGADRT